MNIVVQKFGGTSVASERDRETVVQQIESALANANAVVVVVSAMGRRGQPYATDTLLDLVSDPHPSSNRDLDLLMSCGEIISAVVLANLVRNHGHKVTVLTGQQAGIITDDRFNDANIVEIQPERILEALDKSHVVIVAGYQGSTKQGEVTTLGRGGSDTTAIALGAALHADYVDIFTDVEGILTADPRVVPSARKLSHITYADTYTLAHHGAKVIHPRAVKIAEQAGIPFRVRSMYSSDPGTLVSNSRGYMENLGLEKVGLENSGPDSKRVLGISQAIGMSHFCIEREKRADTVKASAAGDNLATVQHLPLTSTAHQGRVSRFKMESLNAHDTADAELSTMLAHLTLSGVEMDLVSIQDQRVSFVVKPDKAETVNHSIVRFGHPPVPRLDCAKITAVGPDIHRDASVMARFIGSLTQAGIDLVQLGESTNAIWCLVREADMPSAVHILHDTFIETVARSEAADSEAEHSLSVAHS